VPFNASIFAIADAIKIHPHCADAPTQILLEIEPTPYLAYAFLRIIAVAASYGSVVILNAVKDPCIRCCLFYVSTPKA
jgi:hypothetical protein